MVTDVNQLKLITVNHTVITALSVFGVIKKTFHIKVITELNASIRMLTLTVAMLAC